MKERRRMLDSRLLSTTFIIHFYNYTADIQGHSLMTYKLLQNYTIYKTQSGPKRREPVKCASTVEVECTYGHRLKGVSVATCLPGPAYNFNFRNNFLIGGAGIFLSHHTHKLS